MTKEQERKQLEKIARLIEETGADSYISTAFYGCIENARRNIEEDAAYSSGEYVETLQARIKDLEESLQRARETAEALKNALPTSEECREIRDSLAYLASIQAEKERATRDEALNSDPINEADHIMECLRRRARAQKFEENARRGAELMQRLGEEARAWGKE